MSKKDYVALARAICAARDDAENSPSDRYGVGPGAVAQTAHRIADVLAADSERFDRERFMRAALTGDFTAPKRKRPVRCAVCHEETGGIGTSMEGSVHKYGPTTHDFRVAK